MIKGWECGGRTSADTLPNGAGRVDSHRALRRLNAATARAITARSSRRSRTINAHVDPRAPQKKWSLDYKIGENQFDQFSISQADEKIVANLEMLRRMTA